MKKLIIATIVLFSAASCGHKRSPEMAKDYTIADEKARSATASAASPNAEAKAEPQDNDTKTISKKIIKEGDIAFETNDVSATRNAIYGSAQKLGGFVEEENESTNSDNGRKEFVLKARIPAQNFDLFLNNVSANAGRIDTKNISQKDVTADYIDISTQLTNKKKLEERYLELLKKGDNVADLLEIQNKLTEIQTDIESTHGQLNYLLKQVDYSTLTVTFYSRQLIKDDGQNFGYKVRTSLSDGWDILGGMFFGFIAIWPVWIVLAVIFLMIRAWRRRRRNRVALA